MALLLLRQGAMCSQAEGSGYTAFQRYVMNGNSEMVDLLLENDKSGVKAALNHLLVSGYAWNPDVSAPLQVAIENGDSILALKLLDAGAKPEIDLDTWLKAMQVSGLGKEANRTLDDNKKAFKKSVEQPLLCAVRAASADVALRLIKSGANVNCLTTSSENLLDNAYMRSHTRGESLLDVARYIIKQLSKTDTKTSKTAKPSIRPGMDEYLAKLEPGSFLYTFVLDDIDEKKKDFERRSELHNETLSKKNAQGGAIEKREAVDAAISDLKVIETALLEAGAKTFSELHPDIETTNLDNRRDRFWSTDSDEECKVYDYKIEFYGDDNMNESRRQGYIEL